MIVRLPEAIDTIPDALAFWAERAPDAPAFVIPGSLAITYDRLWRRVCALARAIREAGVRRDDRVVLLMPEGADLAAALLAAMSAAVAIPVNAALTAAELGVALDGLGAAAALAGAPLSAAHQERLDRHGVTVHALRGDVLEAAAGMPAPGGQPAIRDVPKPDDTALLLLTSGTTGKPKRAPNTHAALMADGRGRRDLFRLTERDRALVVAPLTLSLGTCVLFHTLAAGGALVFPPALGMPTLWSTLRDERVTWMFPSAGLVEVLIRFLRANPELEPPPALRLVRVTAAPIADETCEELGRRLGAMVLNSYSATETGLIATALPPLAAHRRGSVGRPILEVRVVDADEMDVGPGTPGEIWARTETFFAGYVDDPAANEAALRPGGWYRTGDVGRLDEDGFLYLTGRASELINRGGDKIAPAEVDAALGAHPAVRDAAAFAVPDARWGEDVAAAVVLREGERLSAWELRTWALERLSPHKLPRHIWLVAELPRTELGKVQRSELRRLWLEQHAPPADGA